LVCLVCDSMPLMHFIAVRMRKAEPGALGTTLWEGRPYVVCWFGVNTLDTSLTGHHTQRMARRFGRT
jgi:hypothetical protein